VQENLERKKTNKSKTMSTRDTGDLFYWGSVLENLIPIEESTKDESFSTLSLSPPITKTGELFFFFSTRDRSLRKANHKDKGSC
jgi:spore cortex formation protein SpoVR/YcgB (stage V sporulation)